MIQVLNAHDYRPRELADLANVPPNRIVNIEQFIRSSPQCWVGAVDDKFACMWGLIPPTLLSNNAYLWLIVNALVDEHKFLFVRHSQKEVQRMLDLYPYIVGHCDVRHVRSMEWLRWLGAKFELSDGPVARFTIARKDGSG